MVFHTNGKHSTFIPNYRDKTTRTSNHYMTNQHSQQATNDPAAFAYFQQELMSPRLQQALFHQMNPPQSLKLVQQQHHSPSIMVPPRSSYHFENGWVHYLKRRHHVSTKQEGNRSSTYLLETTSAQEDTWRESLLQYAHTIYALSPQNPCLLDLLHKLHAAYPTHLPTILLLACVYHACQDYQQSLRYNHLILDMDANYVEAMSNIGTTLKSLGKTTEAEQWWYKAIQLRPGYWDAVENLVGVLCTTTQYKEALDVCEFVQAFLSPSSVHQLPRLLNLFYAKGNLKFALGDVEGAQKEYERGLTIAFGGVSFQSICHRMAPLLLPEQATGLLHVLFPEGVLPSLFYHTVPTIQQQVHQTTSTLLLTLAKLYQDVPATTLPLYYLSLALHPSPSTANNLGILLSSMSTILAMKYYMYGLSLDPRHAHLYTNLGSLLKDMGHLNEAVTMYEKAVEYNPRFDVALANLGNAIKDLGRVQESVQWYRRAVEVNPHFVDAVCGLVNSLNGVCDWRGRGAVTGEASVDAFGNYRASGGDGGWMAHVVEIVEKQLEEGAMWGAGTLVVVDRSLAQHIHPDIWKSLPRHEGGWLIRLIESTMRRLQHDWYIQTNSTQTIVVTPEMAEKYKRPLIPTRLLTCPPPVPTVLPFHTFTYPLTARQIRLISHRNALRISYTALTSSWLPLHVYPPPPPPAPRIKLGYVSSDFNNHPLSHLMQSVFGFHNKSQFDVYCYATTPSDHSPYREKIETESEHFHDVSRWSNQQLVEKILQDGIHILINLNGYTKGARNEIFATRPCPVQCSFMGFAGTLGAGWCDWIIADPIVCPPHMVSGEVLRQRGPAKQDLDPEELSNDFVYTEKFVYMPHSYFVNDHKQEFRDDGDVSDHDMIWAREEEKRYTMRRQVFPHLPDDVIVFANFNQLYKLEPGTFRMWLRILERVPNAILWLLRFPPAGEQHLKQWAHAWAGPHVAHRVVFTDVAPKKVHIQRGRVADVFLDTPECNAHTTAADILWSGTPIVTYPKYIHKMCSRVGASIAMATGFGKDMVVMDEQQYEERAVALATSVSYTYDETESGVIQRRGHGALMDLRKRLFLSREKSRLFDTQRWTRNLERGYTEAWRRWVTAEEFDSTAEKSGCIWVKDPDDH